jgi:hypothetical protein
MPEVTVKRRLARLRSRTCIVCDKQFKARRSDAVYCSEACRQKAIRSQVKTEKIKITDRVKTQSKIIDAFYDCQKNYGRVNEIIVECNLIRFSAEQRAVRSGGEKESWGKFTKPGEGRRFNELLDEMTTLLEEIPTDRWHKFHNSDIGIEFRKTLK